MKTIKIIFIVIEVCCLISVIWIAFSFCNPIAAIYISLFSVLAVAMQKEHQLIDWEKKENDIQSV
jgi:hypothetical protein